MKNLSMKEQLRQLRDSGACSKPSQAWVEKNKRVLLSSISQSQSRAPQSSLSAFHSFGRLVFSPLRPVFVPSLVFVITVSGWIATASASYNSLPGDTLYNVKIAKEKALIAFRVVTGNEEEKARLDSQFAVQRSQELRRVAEELKQTPDSTKEKVEKRLKSSKQVVTELGRSLSSANEGIKKIGESDPSKAVDLAKELNKKKKMIVDNLAEAEDFKQNEENIKQVKKEAVDLNTNTTAEVVKNVLEHEKEQKGGGTDAAPSESNTSPVVKEAKNAAKEVIETLTTIANGEIKDAKEATEAAKKTTGESVNPSLATSTSHININGSSSSTKELFKTATSSSSFGVVITEAEKNLEQAVGIVEELQGTAKLGDVDVLKALEQAQEKANATTQVTSEVNKEVKQAVSQVIGQIFEQQKTATAPIQQSGSSPTATNTLQAMPFSTTGTVKTGEKQTTTTNISQ